MLPGGDAGRALHYVSRLARNGDMICEYRGDDEGWVHFDPETGRGVHRYPQLYLENADGVCRMQETGLGAMWWKNPRRRDVGFHEFKDIRAVGVSPASGSMEWKTGFNAVWDAPGHELLGWTERQAGEHYVVTADYDTGARRTWHINPAKGWNAERVVFEVEGWTQEAVCSLEQYGSEVWLPKETRYFKNGRLVELVRVERALFSTSAGPPRFTLGDLGAEPGTGISLQDDPSVLGGRGLRWNGEDVCSAEKWDEDVKSGKRRFGPTFRRIFEQGEPYSSPYDTDQQRRRRALVLRDMALTVDLRKHEALWVKYVEDFIRRYELGEEQEQRAWQLLRACQEWATQYLEQRARDFYNLEQQLQKVREDDAQDKLKRLNDKLATLRKPIDDIFEKRLKPGLERLPTRAQRRATEQRDKAASRPTTAPAAGR